LSDKDKIVDMKKVGDHYEADDDAPEYDPFTEFKYKGEKKSNKGQTFEGQTFPHEENRQPPVKILNPTKADRQLRKQEVMEGFKDFLDGAETVVRLVNDVAKRVERIKNSKGD